MKKRIRNLTEQEKRSLGEQQMIADWLEDFPTGILSIVSDTFDLWKLITEYLPANKEAIMARDGKLVIRPDSGNPVDIICGYDPYKRTNISDIKFEPKPEHKGVIELLWDIFGGTINEQGYKVLDPHIGAIYGDSITLDRQIQIYERLEAKGFASTNIVLGVGSFTYQYNTRDTFGFAAKGAWFQTDEAAYDIYKDPITDDGTKKSLKGMCQVFNNRPDALPYELKYDGKDQLEVNVQCTHEQEEGGLLQTIYEDGKFYNQVTLTEIRDRIRLLSQI
jgi:nicotinamide phosphoribosyltransferase